MKKVFVSRDLKEESPFPSFCRNKGWGLQAMPLIELKALPFEQIPQSDWIFFYSKNGVHFFFQQTQKLGLKLKRPIATIGLGTLNALKAFGKSADFAGNGKPEQVAAAFKILAEGHKVLFPRALHSKKSIQKLLEDSIAAIDLIVYSNEKRKSFVLEEADYLIFTSPMNVSAYFDKYLQKEHQQFIAIGESTASALREVGVRHPQVAAYPSEKELLNTLISLTERK